MLIFCICLLSHFASCPECNQHYLSLFSWLHLGSTRGSPGRTWMHRRKERCGHLFFASSLLPCSCFSCNRCAPPLLVGQPLLWLSPDWAPLTLFLPFISSTLEVAVPSRGWVSGCLIMSCMPAQFFPHLPPAPIFFVSPFVSLSSFEPSWQSSAFWWDLDLQKIL